jgi:hypothetical protein
MSLTSAAASALVLVLNWSKTSAKKLSDSSRVIAGNCA